MGVFLFFFCGCSPLPSGCVMTFFFPGVRCPFPFVLAIGPIFSLFVDNTLLQGRVFLAAVPKADSGLVPQGQSEHLACFFSALRILVSLSTFPGCSPFSVWSPLTIAPAVLFFLLFLSSVPPFPRSTGHQVPFYADPLIGESRGVHQNYVKLFYRLVKRNLLGVSPRGHPECFDVFATRFPPPFDSCPQVCPRARRFFFP